MKRWGVIIVGAGHGGAQAAIALRQHGYAGSIIMIGREPELPYERPPLSKEYLARAKPFERILVRPAAFWDSKQVELLLGTEALAVDPDGQRVVLSDGREIGYDNLIWAAGGSPRRLNCAGAELAGVHVVRDKADVDRIMAELDGGARRAVIIGGGYIGLEAAAVLSKMGCQVTLLEALDRVLARVAGEQLSRFFEEEHRSHGVDLRLGALLDCVEGGAGRVSGVRLADGEVVGCDLVIVGIGVEPTVGPLARAGAKVSNGVEVDGYCRSSLPHVYAIGDCAAHENAFAEGRRIRLESVQNASDMAATCAKAICGNQELYSAVPWFWSNQYDIKLQTVGLCTGFDTTVVRGDVDSRSFSVIYLKDDKVIALDCVNAVKDYVHGKKLVQGRIVANRAALEDQSVPLISLV